MRRLAGWTVHKSHIQQFKVRNHLFGARVIQARGEEVSVVRVAKVDDRHPVETTIQWHETTVCVESDFGT